MWLTEKERITLAVLGTLALIALGILIWRQQRPPLTIEGTPVAAPQAAQWDERLASARQVDVNTATVAELERLPGVGPVLAQRIVDDRTRHGAFRDPEDLQRVKGVGPKTLEGMKDYLTTR